MSVSMLEAKAHELIGQLGPNKLAVIVQLMEVLIHDDEDSDTSVPPRPTRQQRLTSGANTTRWSRMNKCSANSASRWPTGRR